MKKHILILALVLLTLCSASAAPFLPGLYVGYPHHCCFDIIYLDAQNETSGGITFGRVHQITGSVYNEYSGPVTNQANGVMRAPISRGRNKSRGWLRGRVSADGLTVTGRLIFISVQDDKKFRRVNRFVLSHEETALAPGAEAPPNSQ